MIGNHKYFVDSFALGAALPVFNPFYHITTFGESSKFNDKPIEFLRKIGFIKFLYFILGIFPVIRGKDLDVALKEPISIIKEGGVVFLHPEGKIVKEDGIGQFKRGAPFLAEKTGAPVLPLVFKIEKKETGKKREYYVKFGPAFHLPPDLSLEDGAEYMRSIVLNLYESLP